MNIHKFTDLANRITERDIPAPLLDQLNLGIAVISDKQEEDDYYVMGEYIENGMGCHVVLYYGSFLAVLSGESQEAWEEEIRDTIQHELQHHIESLAGEENLARQEEEDDS